jgi:predicted RNase H-like nuclease (RuvC/YqgF family)
MNEAEQCLACGRPLAQVSGGHRKRRYCDDRCRQRGHRARLAQVEREQRYTSTQDAQVRIAELETENARLQDEVRQLQARLNVEYRYRMDTEAHHFKAWLRKLRRHPEGSFAQRFIADKRLPPQTSRALFEAQLKRFNYLMEDVETFRDLWKAMLLQS